MNRILWMDVCLYVCMYVCNMYVCINGWIEVSNLFLVPSKSKEPENIRNMNPEE